MRKYQLFAISACAAVALGIGGCAAKTEAVTTTPAETVETTAETTADVIETVDGTIESMEETQAEALQSIRIYGTVTRDESGRLTIDNQSGQSYSGEIVLNVSDEETLVLDAVEGLPVNIEDIKDGDISAREEPASSGPTTRALRRRSWYLRNNQRSPGIYLPRDAGIRIA